MALDEADGGRCCWDWKVGEEHRDKRGEILRRFVGGGLIERVMK